MRRGKTAFLAAALVAATYSPLRGEFGLGLAGGAIFPGGQDITVRPDDGGGGSPERAVESDAPGSSSGFVALGVTGWTPGRSGIGVRLETMAWKSRFALTELSGLAGRQSIEESFQAGFLFLLGRASLDSRGSFFFAGIGGGVAYESIEGGPRERARAFGALAGAAVPLAPRLRGQIQMHYLICSDSQGNLPDKVFLKTSGSSSGRSVRLLFGPHLDKRFLPVTLGLEWRL
jgi:hypothetical protein